MHIYFCDHCGVRVGEDDLERGLGIRQANEVICHNCVGKGIAPTNGSGTHGRLPPDADDDSGPTSTSSSAATELAVDEHSADGHPPASDDDKNESNSTAAGSEYQEESKQVSVDSDDNEIGKQHGQDSEDSEELGAIAQEVIADTLMPNTMVQRPAVDEALELAADPVTRSVDKSTKGSSRHRFEPHRSGLTDGAASFGALSQPSAPPLQGDDQEDLEDMSRRPSARNRKASRAPMGGLAEETSEVSVQEIQDRARRSRQAKEGTKGPQRAAAPKTQKTSAPASKPKPASGSKSRSASKRSPAQRGGGGRREERGGRNERSDRSERGGSRGKRRGKKKTSPIVPIVSLLLLVGIGAVAFVILNKEDKPPVVAPKPAGNESDKILNEISKLSNEVKTIWNNHGMGNDTSVDLPALKKAKGLLSQLNQLSLSYEAAALKDGISQDALISRLSRAEGDSRVFDKSIGDRISVLENRQ